MALGGKTVTRGDLFKGQDVYYVQRHMNGGQLEYKHVPVKVLDVLRVVVAIQFPNGKERTVRFNELALTTNGSIPQTVPQDASLRVVPPAFASLPKGALDDNEPVRMPPIGAAVPAKPSPKEQPAVMHRATGVSAAKPAAPKSSAKTAAPVRQEPAAAPPRRAPTTPPPAPAALKDSASFEDWVAQASGMLDTLLARKATLDSEMQDLLEEQEQVQQEFNRKAAEAKTVQLRIDAIEKLRGSEAQA